MKPEDKKEIQEVFGALSPLLIQAIEIGVLKALRQHSSEQAVECVQGQVMEFKLPASGDNDRHFHFEQGVLRTAVKTDEVDGERAVWAQAYAVAFGNGAGKGDGSAEYADAAVKAFRARYK